MGTFTLSQDPYAIDIYIYPESDTCTDFTASGDNPNYKCVDEDRLTPDNDTTYVTWNQTNIGFDLYGLPNQNLSGTINYVQVFARTKSQTYPQSADGEFKIIVSPDGTCISDYDSDDIDLTINYKLYSHTWTTNPTDGEDWNWGNINLLAIGTLASSPLTEGADGTATIVPSGVGDLTNWRIGTGCQGFNWEQVDTYDPCHVFINSGAAYGDASDTWIDECYEIQNPTHVGTISQVCVFVRTQAVGGSFINYLRPLLRMGGTSYYGNSFLVGCYESITASHCWTSQPSDSSAWTWAAVDALQAGMSGWLGSEQENQKIWVKHVWVVVHYTQDVSPEIRTTQCYAKVNYTPSTQTCTLNKPDTISLNHSRNIKMINFWSGNRAVYDVNRSGKSMVMTGIEWDDACTKMQCVRTMGENGALVTVDGLGDTLWNGDYYIRSFGWKHITECPDVYEWIIELEDTRHGIGAYD